MSRFFRRFACAREAMAVVEFALVLPIMLAMFYGCIETTRYILIVQKVEKLAHTVADVTAQSRSVTTASLDQLLEATGDIMQPFGTGTSSRVLISSLYRPPGASSVATVNWRHAGGGTLTATSQLGAVGSTPSMPGGFTFNERENVIAAEVFYQFSPLLTSQYFGTTTVYRAAFYKPRLGALTANPT